MAIIKVKTGGVDSTTNLGRRNLIINGAMQVAQRGTSFTGLTGDGGYSIDRFQMQGQADETFSLEQVSDAPDGFSYSYKYTCTTADPTNDAGDYRSLVYQMEGQDGQHLNFGTANAKSLTLSFWVKSNTTGTYSVAFFTSSRIRGVEFTIDTANTWEYKEITIEGDTDASGSISNNNASGLRVYWQLGAGSNYTSGVASSWQAYVNLNWQTSNGTPLYMTQNTTFQLTGVQLEVGTTATPFEHRSFAEEIQLCQRYYCKSYAYATAVGAATGQGFLTSTLSQSFQNTGYIERYDNKYPVKMRAAPAITLYDSAGNSGKCSYYQSASFVTNQNITAHSITENRFAVYSDNSTSKGGIGFQFTADAEF